MKGIIRSGSGDATPAEGDQVERTACPLCLHISCNEIVEVHTIRNVCFPLQPNHCLMLIDEQGRLEL
jgi:hypothetical protein